MNWLYGIAGLLEEHGRVGLVNCATLAMAAVVRRSFVRRRAGLYARELAFVVGASLEAVYALVVLPAFMRRERALVVPLDTGSVLLTCGFFFAGSLSAYLLKLLRKVPRAEERSDRLWRMRLVSESNGVLLTKVLDLVFENTVRARHLLVRAHVLFGAVFASVTLCCERWDLGFLFFLLNFGQFCVLRAESRLRPRVTSTNAGDGMFHFEIAGHTFEDMRSIWAVDKLGKTYAVVERIKKDLDEGRTPTLNELAWYQRVSRSISFDNKNEITEVEISTRQKLVISSVSLFVGISLGWYLFLQ